MGWERQYHRTTLKRVIITVIIILAVVFALVYLARAYTYEGELDPEVFNSWEWVSSRAVAPGIFQVIAKNPDQNGAIAAAVLYINFSDVLVGYLYFKHGEPYRFILDKETNSYVARPFSEEDKQGCMKCHQDKAQDARIKL